MTSKIVVNNIEADAGISSITLNSNITGKDSTQNISGINSVTATSFHGSSVTANTFFGSGSNLTGIDATALKDGSGNVIVQASSLDVVVSVGKTFKPATTNSTDLGTTNERWRNLFVNDAHFSNEGSSNSVDGTWGDWTLQEGENKIFMINNRTGKKYSLKMEEV
jgi:hypothetical protein